MRKALLALGLLVISSLLGWFFLPVAIRIYVEGHYPVRIGHVHLGWPVRFEKVQVNLENTHADLHEVRATPWGAAPIEIRGGSAHTVRRKGKEKPQMPSGGRNLIIRDLQVTVEGDDFLLKMEGVSLGERYQFKTGEFWASEGQLVNLTDGSISKDLQVVSLGLASTKTSLPFSLPEFPSRGNLQAKNIRLNRSTKEATFGEVSFGPITASAISLTKDESLQGKAGTVTLNHPWVDRTPVTLQEVEFNLPPGFNQIYIGVGDATVTISPKTREISGVGSCGDWLQALPNERPEALRVPPQNFSGDMSFEVSAEGSGTIRMKYTCKYTCTEEPIKSLKAGHIRYMAYDSKKERFERVVKRGSPDWVDIDRVPTYVTKAVITLEDPGFLGHRGIIVQALQNSLKDNLKMGTFFRGGSTITQQLAKNLFLTRDKTLSRKVYEAILAMSLETCLSKQEILELYLNVVEYGPDLYGIGPATQRYFNKTVEDLYVEEGFYLASLLPRPSRAVPPDQGGLAAAKKLMAHLVSGGLLPDTYLPEDGEVNSAGWTATE